MRVILMTPKNATFIMADINRDGFPDAIWHDWSNSYGYIRAREWDPTSQSLIQQFDTTKECW